MIISNDDSIAFLRYKIWILDYFFPPSVIGQHNLKGKLFQIGGSLKHLVIRLSIQLSEDFFVRFSEILQCVEHRVYVLFLHFSNL